VYQSFYNLTGKPFRLSPDPTFFFPSRGHKRALAYLRYGLHQNEGFVVITGSPGTGKTMLAQILLNELGDKNIVVAHLTTTQLEADDMLRMVAASFGLRYEGMDKAALLKGIESFLLSKSREQKRALLVIDEAQNLPARSLEELRMLSNLQVGDKALLQTFLLGQAQFRSMLENPDLEQLRQRVIANFHLGPLAPDESQRYIESRLRHVDWNNDPVFAEMAFEKIHEYSEGVPRRINMLCDRIMLFGCMEEVHTITGEIVDSVRSELEQEVASDQIQPAPIQTPKIQIPSDDVTVRRPNPKSKTAQPEAKASTNQGKPADALKYESKPQLHRVQDSEKVADYESKSERSEQRVEPKVPDNFFPEDDQFIDIGDEFIEAFDKSISISDDESEDKARSFINKTSGKVKELAKATTNSATSTETTAVETKPKPGKKADKAEKVEPVAKSAGKPQPEEKDTKSQTESDVQGNTVKHKQPAEVEADTDKTTRVASSESQQISERDLFHVIPGGKGEAKPSAVPKQATMVAKAAGAPSNEDVMLRRILRLVLAFHRSPSSFPGLDDPSHPLPEGVRELLELSVADDAVLTKVSPAAVMGISPVMLRAAVRFFISRTLFANEKDHFRMLGLTSDASVAEIERHYDLLMRLLRQDKQPGAAERVDKIGKAYEALMRFEDVQQEEQQNARDAHSVERAASVLEALESPELTIDFSDDASLQAASSPKPIASFVGVGRESYIPDPRITRRRIHLLGQAAILGIGALVVVLGIFITQLEPDKGDISIETNQPAANNQLASAAIAPPASQVAPVTKTDNEVSTTDVKRDQRDQHESDLKDTKATFAQTEPEVKIAPEVKQAPVVAKVVTNRHSEPTPPAHSTSVVAKAEPVPVSQVVKKPLPQKPEQEKPEPVTSTIASNESSSSKFTAVPVAPVSNEVHTSSVQPTTATPSTAATQPTMPVIPVIPVKSREEVKPVPVTPASSAEASVTTASSSMSNNQFQGKDLPVVASSTITPATTAMAVTSPTSNTPEATATDAAAPTELATAETNLETSISITDTKLQQLLADFSDAFESGNLNKLMGLFASDARTNTQTTRNGIESDYRQLFSTTASRNMTLIAPTWSNEGRFARGVGQYSTNIVPQGGEPTMSKGTYNIQVYSEAGAVKISRFYFSNELISKRGPAASGAPTLSELNTLLTNFTKDYEAGDINNLMKLFADNARTTDQTTLAGIRKDHVDLFDATTMRQIFLKDIVWDTSNTTAVGKGNFEVMVQSKGQTEVGTVNGTITIEAVKTADGTKILKFLHKASQ